jgi:FkbM family methyltransferase
MIALRSAFLSAAFASQLRGPTHIEAPVVAVSQNTTTHVAGQICACEKANALWKAPTSRPPRCVFIDLGAADGNTFHDFISNKYGPVSNCPSGDWEAYLVEANPRFAQQLTNIQNQYPGKVHVFTSTAAYMCEAKTQFYLDTANHDHNYWGSSMYNKHPDVVKSGKTAVDVQTINVIRTVMESTTPGDWVMLKMDIEGAEWDIVPCLAKSPYATLVDRFYLEQHPKEWNDGPTTQAEMDASLATLRQRGVDIPSNYHSQTL